MKYQKINESKCFCSELCASTQAQPISFDATSIFEATLCSSLAVS